MNFHEFQAKISIFDGAMAKKHSRYLFLFLAVAPSKSETLALKGLTKMDRGGEGVHVFFYLKKWREIEASNFLTKSNPFR